MSDITPIEKYPEFGKFLQDCHDGKAATYTSTDSDQVLYNKQALDEYLQTFVSEVLESLKGQYNPSIQDLELGEYQGNEREVIYLDAATAAIHQVLKERTSA